MPELLHSLLKQDIGHLRIIAEFWGLELDSITVEERARKSPPRFWTQSWPPSNRSPLASGGSAITRPCGGEWAYSLGSVRARKYGDIREMGPGKRDGERPHLKPSSTAEILVLSRLVRPRIL